MYVRELQLEGFRTFDSARMVLNVPASDRPGDRYPNVNLVLGDNGAGKTSVLRAIALTSLAPIIASGSGYVPFSLVRRVHDRPVERARLRSVVEMHAQDGPPGGSQELEVELEPTRGYVDRFVGGGKGDFPEMWNNQSPAFLVVGYGATRRADPDNTHSESLRGKARALRYDRVAGLFEEAVTLVPLSGWLPRYKTRNPGRHKQVVNLMNRLLAPHGELLPNPVDDEYLFRIAGSNLPFQALSDGYRGYIGWIADLLYHICMGAPSGTKLVDNHGIVLVDEVDLHLHPEWQRMVIPTLARELPNLQFVFTSHSPIVAGTLWRENVFVLETHDSGKSRHTTIEPSPQEVFGLSADQILTSGHFGLTSTRNDAIVHEIAHQAQMARDGDAEAAIRMLRMMSLGGAEGEVSATAKESAPSSSGRKAAAEKKRRIAKKKTVAKKPRRKR